MHVEFDGGPLGRLRNVVENSGMDQKVVNPAFADCSGGGAAAAAAAEFGGDEYLAHGFGLGVVHAAGFDFDQAQVIGRRKSLGCGFAGRLLNLVFERVVSREGQKFEGFAAGEWMSST